ncbi:MAG TPA: hypothetical protein VFO86_11880, partial [Terriglobia bacterium]|nr:hypothetical protein [Terriglobia bacterium]
DVEKREKPLWIRVQESPSLWRLPSGITTGDDLHSIEKRNGWPFRMAGFTSEGHGALQNWGDGRLEPMLSCSISMIIQPQSGTPDSLLKQVTSLASVSSGHPAMQEINPRVVAISIQYHSQKIPMNSSDALLDVLVFGAHMSINPALLEPELRRQVEQYLRRVEAYSRAPGPVSSDLRLAYNILIRYEARLAAQIGDSNNSQLAKDYVAKLRPCYEWEGYHDCPEREAKFADDYIARNPGSPLHDYLSLLSAQRWLCAAEGYDYEKDASAASRSRGRAEQAAAIALRSKTLMIRSAAERLSQRKTCFSP